MIVLDAYAVVAPLRGEAAASEVADLLHGDEDAMLTTLGVAEVVDRLIRLVGVDPDEVVLDVAALGLLDAAPLAPSVALRAGLLRARRYHRTRCAVSLADCVAVEVAREEGAAVATSDPHLLDVCHDEGVAMVVLPDSAGVRWSPDQLSALPGECAVIQRVERHRSEVADPWPGRVRRIRRFSRSLPGRRQAVPRLVLAVPAVALAFVFQPGITCGDHPPTALDEHEEQRQ